MEASQRIGAFCMNRRLPVKRTPLRGKGPAFNRQPAFAHRELAGEIPANGDVAEWQDCDSNQLIAGEIETVKQ